MAANEWWAVTKSEDSFYMHGGMGFAASFALGLASALPEVPVWVLNSDGSLSMNLGCLLTEAGQQPKNLKHFVVDNQRYRRHRFVTCTMHAPGLETSRANPARTRRSMARRVTKVMSDGGFALSWLVGRMLRGWAQDSEASSSVRSSMLISLSSLASKTSRHSRHSTNSASSSRLTICTRGCLQGCLLAF